MPQSDAQVTLALQEIAKAVIVRAFSLLWARSNQAFIKWYGYGNSPWQISKTARYKTAVN
eukprot:5520570-Pleurochrysis_carterae.AAC.2